MTAAKGTIAAMTAENVAAALKTNAAAIKTALAAGTLPEGIPQPAIAGTTTDAVYKILVGAKDSVDSVATLKTAVATEMANFDPATLAVTSEQAKTAETETTPTPGQGTKTKTTTKSTSSNAVTAALSAAVMLGAVMMF